MENLVTIPIESALTGIADVTTVRSKSVLGLSQVVLILKHGADNTQTRQLVQERLPAVARRLLSAAHRCHRPAACQNWDLVQDALATRNGAPAPPAPEVYQRTGIRTSRQNIAPPK